jgi:GDPmannose 4,6-dehydratase
MNMKKALITGITGQDGSYLAELLLGKGYEVYGLIRRVSVPTFLRINHILDKVKLIQSDLIDQLSLIKAVDEAQPDEVYNLGAMSHVKVSFDSPEYVANVDGTGTLRILEAVRILGLGIILKFLSPAKTSGSCDPPTPKRR